MMQNREEVFYSNLSLIAKGATDSVYSGNWLNVPYETADFKGVALFAGETYKPGPLTLKLGVNGWYKIYLSIAEVTGSNFLEVSLSGDGEKTIINPSHLRFIDGTFSWSPFDFGEEIFYKAADLTGQDLIINKPTYGVVFTSSLFAIRLVPMTEEEVNEHKNPKNTGRMAYHFDNDYMRECDYTKPSDVLGRIDMIYNGNANMIIHECNTWSDEFSAESISYFRVVGASQTKFIKENQSEINDAILERAHTYGMKCLTGCRMTAGKFLFPSTNIIDNSGDFGKGKFCIVTREGRSLASSSYAYKPVRDIMVKSVLDRMPENWDGVSIFLQRGILVGFEEPICTYVYEKYGVDAKKLPYGDYRLTEALSLPMTEFFRELSFALKERAKRLGRNKYLVNVVSLFSLENCKEFGYDLDAWAKEGLIDSVCQGLMGYKEKVDGLVNNDGFIDLERYREEQKTRHVFTRYYDADKKVILESLPSWFELSKKYGIEFYATMPWEHPDYNGQIDMAKTLYEAGAENLFSWNANHSAKRPATIQGIKCCGDKQKVLGNACSVYRKVFRIYSLGGNDVSMFCVNWNG